MYNAIRGGDRVIDLSVNDRFRTVRKLSGLSQEKFGEPMGMTRDEVKNVEYDKTSLREDKGKLLCSAYGVRAEWLWNGEGDMMRPQSVYDQIGKAAAEASKHDPEDAIRYFQNLYRDLGEANFLLLYQVFRSILPQYDKSPNDKKE